MTARRVKASFSLARTPLASLGVVLTTLCGVLFVVLFLIDSLGWFTNPYVGLVLFVALPIGFVAGLALIPIGNAIHTRSGEAFVWPLLNLNEPTHRTGALLVLVATALNVVIITMATSGALHYMETASFCGNVCHSVMEPHFVAYQRAPHSRVPCVSCHVGAGAQAAVRSKLNGTRQLFGILTGRYERPIPSPVGEMRTAQETCAACHWAEMPYAEKVRVLRSYADDEASSESVTNLTLHMGATAAPASADAGSGSSEPPSGGMRRRGIHWHARSDTRIEYVATDERHQDIPLVVLVEPDGSRTEFRVESADAAALAGGRRHRMDCVDCHNRPSHTFAASAERAVDDALAAGRVDRRIPFVRRELVTAVKAAYDTPEAAAQGIERQLRAIAPGATPPPQTPDMDRLVAVAKDLYSANVFPRMRVSWGTYASELGHSDAPGCFRCHDDNHKAADGRVIRQDCELCHDVSFGEADAAPAQ